MKPAQRVLTHPLLILVVGAALSAVLGPYVSKVWQDHAEALSVKSELVQRINAASASLLAAVQAHEFQPKIENPRRYVLDFRTWDTEAQVIDGEIATYFPGEETLRQDWRDFSLVMLDYFNLGDRRDPTLRQELLERLYAYTGFRPDPPELLDTRSPSLRTDLVYQRGWRSLKYGLIDARNELVRALLEAEVSL